MKRFLVSFSLMLVAACVAQPRIASATATTGIVPSAIDSSFQPPVTYTRPLNFPTLQVVNNAAIQGNSYATQPIDVHAYSSAIISFAVAGAGAGTCTYMPIIGVFTGPTATGLIQDRTAPNSNYTTINLPGVSQASSSYNVQLTQNFISVLIGNVANPGGTSAGCTVTLYITLVPAPLPSSGATYLQQETIVAVNGTPGIVSYPYPGMRHITIQNQGTSIVFCNLANGTQPGSTAGVTAKTLAACLVTNDGTGGSTDYSDWAGTVYCFTSGAAGSVGVTAY